MVTLEHLLGGLDHCLSCGSPWPLFAPTACPDCGLPIYSFQDTVRETRGGEEVGELVHLFCRPDQEAKNAEDRRKAAVESRERVIAIAISILGLICGIIGFLDVVIPILIPLGPIAVMLGAKASIDLNRLSEDESHLAVWVIWLGVWDSLAGIGFFIIQ